MSVWFRCKPLGGHGLRLITQLQPRQQTPDGTTCTLNIPFDNVTLRHLPLENNVELSTTHRQVKDACFTRIPNPEPIQNPKLVAYSKDVIQKLHLAEKSVNHHEFVDYFSGRKLFPGSEPAAHCYCGFQYGLFSGQLGDGAVMYIGDTVGQDGRRYEVQLKGSGKTPFSRASSDGRKVLRSSIREMLASEALAYLGIPTSRVATCVTSDTDVFRDVMYSGDISTEKATIICRIAPTFLRIGSLEVTKGTDPSTGKAGPSAGNLDLLKSMLDFTISTHYPQLYSDLHIDSGKMYISWFKEFVSQNAQLVAQWQSVGFSHGVLNTDNISLVGTTIDYGPYGFMEVFDPDYVCNGSDHWARYSFRRQPEMVKWCLLRLSETLEPLVPRKSLHKHMETFDTIYKSSLLTIMHQKLGLQQYLTEDGQLIDDLLRVMQITGSDYSKTFRCLSGLHNPRCAGFHESFTITKQAVLRHCCSVEQLKDIYSIKDYPSPEMIRRSLRLLHSNPELLPQYVDMSRPSTDLLNSRNIVTHVQNMTRSEKREQDDSLWEEWLTKYSERLLVEMGRDTFTETMDIDRRAAMDKNNPRFILRNHVMQHCIESAENGDFRSTRALLELVQNPFDEYTLIRGCTDTEMIQELMTLHDENVPRKKIQIT